MDTEAVEVAVVVRRAAGVRRVEVVGDVDQVGAAVLRDVLDKTVAEQPDRIEVDLAGATFFCCAGVAALLAARNASGGRVVLVGAAEPVRKVLTILNLTSAF